MFEDWISALATQPAAADRPGLCNQLAAVSRLRTAVDACEARLLAAVDALDDDGASASAVARSVTRCSQREADRRARRADTLTQLPSAADAMASGDLSAEHIDALGRAVEATSAEAVEDAGLVHQAGRRSADQAARQVREWTRSRQSDDDLQRAHQRRYASRRLSIFRGDDGMTVLHGEFDPVTGRQIRQAINTATDRLFQADGGRGVAGDVRSGEQRRADALAQLLGVSEHSVAAAPPAGAERRPVRNQLLVLARLADGELVDASLVDGSPLPSSVLARLACGSDLFGLVMSQGGDPLWAGRRVRLATDAQWRALIARDRGCVICDADPALCEAHHLLAWQPPGCGPTDVDNLVLVCRHHHHLVHDLGWRLECCENGLWSLEPP